MLAVMGTSTCHVMNAEVLAEVPGMCGVVEGGITPGLLGYEAGQSGVGDIFAWFVEQQLPGRYLDEAARARSRRARVPVGARGAPRRPGAHGLVALDWHSGNRSVLVDHELSGAVVGLTLRHAPEDVYRALIEATAFGARTIVETFESSGLPVREFTVAGGLVKNALLMQIYSDVLRRPLHVVDSEEGPALGAAIHAAVAAGCHDGRPRRVGRDGQGAPQPLPARPRRGGSLRRALRPLHGAARPLRPPQPDDARAARLVDAARGARPTTCRRSPPRSPRCTRSSSATGS